MKENKAFQEVLARAGKDEKDLTVIEAEITIKAEQLKSLMDALEINSASGLKHFIYYESLYKNNAEGLFGKDLGYHNNELMSYIYPAPDGWNVNSVKQLIESIDETNALAKGITIKLPIMVGRDDKELQKVIDYYQEEWEEYALLDKAENGKEIARYSEYYSYPEAGDYQDHSDKTVFTYDETEGKYYSVNRITDTLYDETPAPTVYEITYDTLVEMLADKEIELETERCSKECTSEHKYCDINDGKLSADVVKAVNEKLKEAASKGNVLAEVTLIGDINAYEATRYDKIRFVQKDNIYYGVGGDEEDFEEEASAQIVKYNDMLYLLSDAYALKTGQELKYNQFKKGTFISSIDFKDEYLKAEAFLNTKEGDRYCEFVEEMLKPYRGLTAEVIKNAAETAETLKNTVEDVKAGLIYTDYNPQTAILDCYICPAEISGFEPDEKNWKSETKPSDIKWFEVMFNDYSCYSDHGELKPDGLEMYGCPFGISDVGNIVSEDGVVITNDELIKGYNERLDDIQQSLHRKCLIYKDFIGDFNTTNLTSAFEHELTEDEWHKQIERQVTQDITDSINAGAGVMSKDLHEEKPKKYRKSVYERD